MRDQGQHAQDRRLLVWTGGDRDDANTTLAVVGASALLIIVAEALVALADPLPGVALHAALLFVLLGRYALAPDRPGRRILTVIALVPLLRLLSLAVPSAAPSLAALPEIYWLALIAVPLGIAMLYAARVTGFLSEGLPFPKHSFETQALIALHGVPLGSFGYYILRPEPVDVGPGLWGMIGASLILSVAGAFLEELLFRHLLLRAFHDVLGGATVLVTALLFAATYFGTRSPGFIVLMAAVGLLFGLYAHLSRSIWGVTAAHALLLIGMLVAWPRMLA